MTTKALIVDGRAREILTADPFPPFHEDLVWIEIPEGAAVPKEGDVWDGKTFAASVQTFAQTIERLKALVQAHLDATARAYGYNEIASVVTYADEPSAPKFQAEGLAFRAWRSKVWAACLAEAQDIQAGNRLAPSEDELLASLPALGLPAPMLLGGPVVPT